MEQMSVVTFPAVLILSAVRPGRRIVAFSDGAALENDEALRRRLAMYRRLEEAGAAPYHYQLAPVDQADAIMAGVRARRELEAGLRFSLPAICLGCEHECCYFGDASHAAACTEADRDRRDNLETRARP